MQETQVPVLNSFAGALVQLIEKGTEAVASCLQILINITYESPNTSVHLSRRRGFITMLMALITNDTFASDATWLLSHLCADGMIDSSQLN